ncbi:STAS domain-containing protein [Saccharopolyspora halophila]|uniref:STAS domain-containing protein n=1 Tax=Saccharopolyspora halophila TaxID=405551 RepID=UPI0031D20162
MINSPSVFAVDSELTGPAAAALAGRLWPDLLTAPTATVVDLAAARTIDSTGVDLLAAAHAYALHRGCELRIVNAAPGVHRALRAAGVRSWPAKTRGASTSPECRTAALAVIA